MVGSNRYTADHIVVATGGQPLRPALPGQELGLTSDEFFAMHSRPNRVAVIGSGYIAVEIAGVLNAFGSKVELVARGDTVLREFDTLVQSALMREMRSAGIEFHLNTLTASLAQDAGGIHLTSADGSRLGGFDAVMVDLTNPAARSWLKEILRTQIIGNGMRGWMADFGEALPYRSQLYSGEDSAGYHNHYAEEWAALNREVLQETGHEGELFFFSRSGFTRSPGKSTLFWSGDQLASWDAYDGLGSAIVALLTSGLSGISLNHWDIGGYAGIDLVIHKALPPFKITRSKELLLRWLEITPFTALMRTHEGTPPEDHHQISSSPEATAAFAFSSRVFAALFDYRRGLMQEAATRGYPLVRHPMLHYPDDATCALLSDQFMLGDAFMVAPVVVPGAMERRLYLPRGVWVHLWSGVTFDMGQLGGWLTILAPVGKPAVFFRQDAAAGWRLYRQTQAMMSSAPEPVQPLTGTHHG